MRTMFAVVLSSVMLAVVAPPAVAVPPTHREVTAHQVLSDPAACGDYGVSWDINLTADIWTFFDTRGGASRRWSTCEKTTR